MMKQKLQSTPQIEIYNYDSLFKRLFILVDSELSKEDADLIKKYDQVMVLQSLAKATRSKHLKIMLSLSKMINKGWKDVTKSDVENLVYEIMQRYGEDSGQESETSRDFKKVLKIFFRWYKLGSRDKDEVGDPPETKGIKLKRPKDKIVREDLVTDADRTRLLHACGENVRDRAFIDCHSEAGTRPGEILSLKIRHVKFDNYGAVIHVDGKTGPRSIRLVRSTPNLAQWLAVHPFKSNPDAPLWIITEKNYYGRPFTYATARKLVKDRCEKAKLPKRVNLNLFRHSEATESAKFMTEAQMKMRHGWTNDSKMPGRYVHLVNADVENAILSHYGVIKEQKTIQDLPRKCNVCEMMNSPESKICCKCGKALDLKTAMEMDEKKEERIEKLLEDYKKLDARTSRLEKIASNNRRLN